MGYKFEAEVYVEYLKNRFPELNSEVLELKNYCGSTHYEVVIDKKPMFKIFLRYHGVHQPYGYEISRNWEYECINKIYQTLKKQKSRSIDVIKKILEEYNIQYKIEKLKPEERNDYYNAYLIFSPDDSSVIKWEVDTEKNRVSCSNCYTSPEYHKYLMNIILDLKQNINIIINNINNKNNLSDAYRYYLSGVIKKLKLNVKGE